MSRKLESSLLFNAFNEIVKHPGSPYMNVTCAIRAGGGIYTPLKVLTVRQSMDFAKNFADVTIIHVLIPSGDVVKYITPFQDDLMIDLMINKVAEGGGETDEEDVLTRTYKAYLVTNTKTALEDDYDSQEMQNLSNIDTVEFIIEEVLVEQMRYKRTGGISLSFTTGMQSITALLDGLAKSIKFDEGDEYKGITVDEGYSNEKFVTRSLPRGEKIVDVPDIIQNDFNGLYKDALGFYMRHNSIFLWGLYGLDRKDVAKRTLRIYIAPDKKSGIVERTWYVPEDSPEVLEVWAMRVVSVSDDSVANRLIEGTGSRSVDPEKVMEGFVDVKGNRVSVRAEANNKAFARHQNVDGKTVIAEADSKDNPYVQASKVAKGAGMKVSVMWKHSLMSLLTPGMYVEIIFDHKGEIVTLPGSLLETHTMISAMGKGVQATRSLSATVITAFVDREVPEFKEWLEEGAPGASEQPQQG